MSEELPICSSYRSTSSRDPIWTRVAEDPNDRRSVSRGDSPNLVSDESRSHVSINEVRDIPKGLNVLTAAVFIAGELAGSGVLALPRAVVDSGWIGLVLIVYLCVNAAYGGTRLGTCWAILEERYPEYRTPVRNPYATIAFKAVGRWASLLVSASIQVTLFGAGTVYLLLASQIIQQLLENVLPKMGFCIWLLIIGALITPLTWLGTPKDFRLVGVGAVLTTGFACICIFAQILIDGLNSSTPVIHEVHGFTSFFLAFGTILFSFGGASTFPTIQNDMIEKTKFTTSVTIGFSVILMLYLPVAAAGYYVYGEAVNPNIVLSLPKSILAVIANILLAIHLVLAFLIIINPVCQELEEIANIPRYFNWKRCLVRTSMLCIMVFVGESVPKFGKILSLVGGSTVTLLTFVLPPYFYMKLCDQEKNEEWPERGMHLRLRPANKTLNSLVDSIKFLFSAYTENMIKVFKIRPLISNMFRYNLLYHHQLAQTVK
ncbi:hypothetical protein L9F63_009343, partial [Diploptera punctata]